MAHEHERRARRDARGKGQKVGGLKGLIAALVNGDARVGVDIVAVAGEVLQHARNARRLILRYDPGNVVCRRLRVLSERAGMDKVVFIGRYVAHGGEIHVDAERLETLVIAQRFFKKAVHPRRGVQLLRRLEGRGKEVRVPARARDGAALLIAADEKRKVRRGLIGRKLCGKVVRA